MNPLKAEQLFKLMKQYGVSHFKHKELEIRTDGGPATPEVTKPNSEIWTPLVSKELTPSQAAPPVESKVPHHVNEVASLLKLNDEELVDKLFPDYSNMPFKVVNDG